MMKWDIFNIAGGVGGVFCFRELQETKWNRDRYSTRQNARGPDVCRCKTMGTNGSSLIVDIGGKHVCIGTVDNEWLEGFLVAASGGIGK